MSELLDAIETQVYWHRYAIPPKLPNIDIDYSESAVPDNMTMSAYRRATLRIQLGYEFTVRDDRHSEEVALAKKRMIRNVKGHMYEDIKPILNKLIEASYEYDFEKIQKLVKDLEVEVYE